MILYIIILNNNKTSEFKMCLIQTVSVVLPLNKEFETIWEAHMELLILCSKCGRKFFPGINKNYLGSFQVLWNRNFTTEKEDIMMIKINLKKVKMLG